MMMMMMMDDWAVPTRLDLPRPRALVRLHNTMQRRHPGPAIRRAGDAPGGGSPMRPL
mgnify:CR=1 FL=1